MPASVKRESAAIRFIFCDLDGTLLDDNKTPSMVTINYFRDLKRHFDVQIGIASGRAPSSILPMLHKFQIEDVIDVVIANNGVDTIGSKSRYRLQDGMISKAKIASILHAFQSYSEIAVSFHNPDVLYATRITKRVKNIVEMNRFQNVLDPHTDSAYRSAARVMLLFDPKNRSLIEDAVNKHPIQGLKGYFAEPDIYEFSCLHVSKHKAIERYVRQFDGTLDQVMVFGDSGNDLGMLQHCGIGVVMKNAECAIQQRGDFVTEYTNEEDGIYEFLHRYEHVFHKK